MLGTIKRKNKICAIICEYNPFHTGHARQIALVKEKYDKVVCLMSGNFTQRAEPAFCDKYLRAETAVKAGADAVFALPTVYAAQSARIFAEGAVNILRNFNIDAISFGMENPDVISAKRIAEIKNSEAFSITLKNKLGSGLSFATASAEAVAELAGESAGSVGKFLSSPNNLLAVEYLTAIKKFGMDPDIFAVKREGEYGSDDLGGEFASASALRKALLTRNEAAEKFVPFCDDVVNAAHPDYTLFEIITLAAVRGADRKEAADLLNAGEGIENKLIKNSSLPSLAKAVEATKSRRYTYGRIKRLCLDFLLGTRKSDLDFPDVFHPLLLAAKSDVLGELGLIAPTAAVTRAEYEKYIPENFARIEDRAEKIYSLICSVPFSGYVKKLASV